MIEPVVIELGSGLWTFGLLLFGFCGVGFLRFRGARLGHRNIAS
ncbi:hypothetical protein ACWGTI_01915 [Mesorhizobium sp. ArgA1]